MKCIYTWKVLRRKSSKSLGINMQLKIIFGLERRTLYVCVCCPSKCDCSINIINIQLHHSRNNQFLASKHFALNKLNSNSDNSIEKFCMTNESKEHPHNPNGSKRSYPERRERERGGGINLRSSQCTKAVSTEGNLNILLVEFGKELSQVRCWIGYVGVEVVCVCVFVSVCEQFPDEGALHKCVFHVFCFQIYILMISLNRWTMQRSSMRCTTERAYAPKL